MSDVIQSRAIFFAPMTFHHNPNRRSNHSLTSIRKAKEKNNFALSAPLRVFRDVNTLRTSCIFKKCAGKRFEDLPRAQRRFREAHSYLHPPEEALLGGPQKTML